MTEGDETENSLFDHDSPFSRHSDIIVTFRSTRDLAF